MFYNTVNKASVFELLSIVKVSDLQTTCRLLGERVKAQQHKHFNKSISFLKPNSSIDLSQINIDCYCLTSQRPEHSDGYKHFVH